jgi:uncharacterized protein (TIGR03118 family)
MIRPGSLRLQTLLASAVLLLALAPRMNAATVYVQHNLVSDIPLLADFTDPNLVNPWGISFSATSPFWLCDAGTGLSTVYTASATVQAGTVSTTVVTVPANKAKLTGGRCTGTVVSPNAALFAPAPGVNANFLFATEDGSLSSRNGSVATVMVDNSATGAVYTGLALGVNGGVNFLYAANFNSGAIEVYDGQWNRVQLGAGAFTDAQVPAGFAPFNIQGLNGKLYVAYAKQDAAKQFDVAGPGNGYVAVFNPDGSLAQHLISGGPLNSPWGLAIAPSTFGDFKGALLVGNFRDGRINAFDITTGALLGSLTDASGKPITNVGLWGLAFGNGGSGGDPNKLYFAAGIGAGGAIESHGLFGVITVGTTPGAAPSVSDNGVVNSATFAAGTNPVAPGAIVSVFGSNLTDGSSCTHNAGCDQTFDNTKRLRTFMAGTQVFINNDQFHPAPIFAATPAQLNIQLPPDVTGPTATIQVNVNGQTSVSKTLNLAPLSPGIFSFNSQGTGAGAITHNDTNGTPISSSAPAKPGETIVIYATGLGATTPVVPIGTAPTGLTALVTTPTVTIDGLPAQVTFSGLAPCCVGLNQVNVVVPAAVHVGTNVDVVVTLGSSKSNTVTLATAAAASGTAVPDEPEQY